MTTKAKLHPVSTQFRYSDEAREAGGNVPERTVSAQSHDLGMRAGEPLIIMLDCLIQYAHSYRTRQESPLAEDYVLGPEWLASAKAVRALLDGDGALAMSLGITTDSKDNGACEAMFWSALKAAGFTEADL